MILTYMSISILYINIVSVCIFLNAVTMGTALVNYNVLQCIVLGLLQTDEGVLVNSPSMSWSVNKV